MAKVYHRCSGCGKMEQVPTAVAALNEAAANLDRLREALLLCRTYADKAMAIDPNDPLAITVEAIVEGRMGPLAAEAAGGSDE